MSIYEATNKTNMITYVNRLFVKTNVLLHAKRVYNGRMVNVSNLIRWQSYKCGVQV